MKTEPTPLPVPTPHISCMPGDFADTVLMPGDPLRSKFIAETYLTDAKLVNNVRGIQGYTGLYNGKRVSVMASGMGMPSMALYSYELFNFYGVKNILRIGSAGSMQESLPLRSIVLGLGASTNSNYAEQYGLSGTFAPVCSYELLKRATDTAEKLNIPVTVGNVYSSDTFYSDDANSLRTWQKMGILCTEMEAAALYMNAARAGKNALAILTISDCVFTGESCSSEERQNTFTKMMELALEMA